MRKFLLVILTTFSFSLNTFADDNIVVVLDTSGSMSDSFKSNPSITKMEAAKDVLINVLKTIPDETNVGLVTFGGWFSGREWVYPLGKLNKSSLVDKVREINSGGGTPLGQYLKVGADSLLKEREKEHGYGTYKLMVISDGEATDQGYVEKFLPEILARGIRVDVIGIDMRNDISLAKMVNSYRTAQDKEGLEKAVRTVLAEVKVGSDSIEDFEYMNGFQDQNAVKKVIEALTERPNHPIGEKPEVKIDIKVNKDVSSTATTNNSDGTSYSTGWLIFLAVSVTIVIIIGFLFIVFNPN